MGRDAVTFGKRVRYYTLTMPRPILPPKGYPASPVTIGEHLRKKRLDLGLTQAQVAEITGVTESTVWNWEHGTPPNSRHRLKITKFLDDTSAPNNNSVE